MKNIKILVSCHKEFFVPKRNFLFPIQVGALDKKPIEGFLTDDTGDNISEKNARYCELTAQYWAWKNLDAEYYGFFHYRRYLAFCDVDAKVDAYGNAHFENLDENNAKILGLDEKKLEDLVDDFDVVVPYPANLKKDGRLGGKANVAKHFALSLGHDIKELEGAIQILKRLHPDFAPSADKFLNSKECYFANMYILKKEIFFRYCEWLFPILDEFDRNKDYKNLSIYEKRMPGFLAERLFNIFLDHLKETENIKIRHTRQCFFENAEVQECNFKPAFDKNNIAVALSSDDNYVPYLGVAIRSIVENAKSEKNYDFLILSNEITERNKEKLKSELKGLNNCSIRFFEASLFLKSQKLYERHNINRTTYLRLLIPYILKNFDKVVYLDCDLVVNHDIAELYSTDLKDNLLAAVIDTVQAGWCKIKNNPAKEYNQSVLKLKNEFEYFNAGVIVMNLKKFRETMSLEKMMDFASSREWIWQDQDVLNALCENKTVLLPQEWNVCVQTTELSKRAEAHAPERIFTAYKNALLNPKIVHYAGKVIPTMSPNVDHADLFFKYAMKSVFISTIIEMTIKNTVSGDKGGKVGFKQKVKSWLVKYIFPKNTRRREFAKRIYYKMKSK